jgi:DNA modification methylase
MLPDSAKVSEAQKTLDSTNVEDLQLPLEEIINGKKVLYDTNFKQGYDVVLGCNDTLAFIEDIPDNSLMLVVSSPPYNIGKPYEERLEFREYLKWQQNVIKECTKKLSPRGSICWEVGNYIEDGEVFPLDLHFYKIFKECKLKLRNKIIWKFGHGLHARNRFSGRYETLLWFTKGDDYIFNLDSVRVPQKYPGKLAYKGLSKGQPTSNPLGKNPSDIWDTLSQEWYDEIWENLAKEWDSQIWDIPNVKSNHPEKTIHPSQFPIELVERLVLALTNEKEGENLVYDPFIGVGSSIAAAVLHNRKGIGVDKMKQYTDVAYRRILSALNGTIKKRPMGKPIHVPKESDKVARVPDEWINKKLDTVG